MAHHYMEEVNLELQKIIDEAMALGHEGDLGKAIRRLSGALDILVAGAKSYAQKCEPVSENDRGVSDQYLIKFNEYLKKDKTACVLSNAMALMFAKNGNVSSAVIFFEQAIDLTPAGMVYDDPHIGLEMLKGEGR